jgi:predicted membrane channel-forming protein YqfA (hemolysin III family)
MTRHAPSWRTAAGILLIVAVILVWALLIASFSPVIGRWPILIQAAFYLIMGIVWIIPLKPLVRWMNPGAFKRPPHSD